MTRKFLFACAVASIASTHSAAADPSLTDLAARHELRAIETLTLTDQQFLTGDRNGKPVTIAGQLRIPQRTSGRVPAVILLHGSGGLNAGHELWSRHFNEMGIAAFLIDAFTGRGLTSTSTNQALLGRFNMILDAYRGLDMIAGHARIDPARIAAMGFSRGGQSALYSSLKRFQQSWTPKAEFAAYIPFYASCQAELIDDTDVGPAPIRMFHGAADDYNPVAPCRAYAARLRAAGRDVQLTEFPGVPHSYDNPLGAVPARLSKGSQSVRDCKLKEQERGTILNMETGQPFTYKDACVRTDPHVGYDAAASNATRTAVKDFLRTTFRLQ
jgi:dienelactone hydrolase